MPQSTNFFLATQMEHDQSSYFCLGPDDFCWGPAPVGPTLLTGPTYDQPMTHVIHAKSDPFDPTTHCLLLIVAILVKLGRRSSEIDEP